MQTLKLGATGPDVQKWQELIGIPSTVAYDSTSVALTKTWQAKQGLTVDGEVGPQSWKRAIANGPVPRANRVESAAKSAAEKAASATSGLPLWAKLSAGGAVVIGAGSWVKRKFFK